MGETFARWRASLLIALVAILSAGLARAEDWPKALRIGYQKNGLFLIVKHQGVLAKSLAEHGTTLQWVEFPSGPPMLEALNAGSLDMGYIGDTPPIFAQAAGSALVYVASQAQPGESYAILVPKDSGIQDLAGLAGKRIGFTKGSAAQNLLVNVLAHAGIDWRAITPVYLSPPDASAAFQAGQLDAWAIWDPFFAIAQLTSGARVLTNAVGISPTNVFFVAERGFARDHGAAVEAVIADLGRAAAWANDHRDEVAQLQTEVTGVSIAAAKIAAAREHYSISPMTDAVIAQQQGIADSFFKLHIIPKPITIRDIVWHPSPS
jgi:sulfonate transport system substrate-binding protein